MNAPIPPLRDPVTGQRIPDDIEREAMRQAALREDGSGRPSIRDDTPGGLFCRVAGAESRQWVNQEAVREELRTRRNDGRPDGGDVRDQLEIMHRHLDIIDLRDRNDLHEFKERIEREASVAAMGPGSGICEWLGGDEYRGDPEMIRRSREARAARARMAAQAQASQDASAVKFAGPYRLYESVK